MNLALYREFRPKNFNEVVGQDYIIQTLKNQIKNNRLTHAYLFCGPRGTGKTSTAKIFAKAVNCTNAEEGNPCGLCAECVALNQANTDILEIDAASNNRVEEIRDLRDKVVFPPLIGKYKVYIVDEVHMLTDSAFNALLKTLEEPPAHVIFILATTEIHKLRFQLADKRGTDERPGERRPDSEDGQRGRKSRAAILRSVCPGLECAYPGGQHRTTRNVGREQRQRHTLRERRRNLHRREQQRHGGVDSQQSGEDRHG